MKKFAVKLVKIKAIFHCGRFARVDGTTNFNHVKNQSRGHVKKVECSSTFMACPRAFKRTKNAQDRQLQRKLSNVRSARAGKATAMENCLKIAVCEKTAGLRSGNFSNLNCSVPVGHTSSTTSMT